MGKGTKYALPDFAAESVRSTWLEWAEEVLWNADSPVTALEIMVRMTRGGLSVGSGAAEGCAEP